MRRRFQIRCEWQRTLDLAAKVKCPSRLCHLLFLLIYSGPCREPLPTARRGYSLLLRRSAVVAAKRTSIFMCDSLRILHEAQLALCHRRFVTREFGLPCQKIHFELAPMNKISRRWHEDSMREVAAKGERSEERPYRGDSAPPPTFLNFPSPL
ncbi:hypothetical protein AVEN_81891-1 [Araneus ventricosus]|uniref:Uncharacterized protein n=1 Tax=Araneus ventricosus TaxID=182803 RepID=A0A4Y2I573_ARAVE|nr:hypothetical protein AVEN_81891-1 [Araneus ventricosus]